MPTTDLARTLPIRALTLRETVPLAEVLQLLQIEPMAGGQLHCPSPTHADAHPSAKAYGLKVHCFGCGETWDVIGLVQVVRGLGFAEAVAYLEGEFDVATGDPATLVRVVLQRVGATDYSGLLDATRATMVAARARMSLSTYARLFRAYDLARTAYAARTIDGETLVATMDRILALVPPLEVA